MRTLSSSVAACPRLVERHHHRPPRRTAAQPPARRNSSSPSLRLIELTIALPCTACRPASSTDHLLLSIITGTVAMSLSPAIKPQEPRHHRFAVEQALVHVDVDDVGSALDLLPRHLDRFVVLFLFDEPGELCGEPVTFVRSPIIRKLLSGRSVHRLMCR